MSPGGESKYMGRARCQSHRLWPDREKELLRKKDRLGGRRDPLERGREEILIGVVQQKH